MSRIYLAHPITALLADDVFRYYDGIGNAISEQHICLSPMSGKDELRNVGTMERSYDASPVSNSHAIYERDMWMVATADIVLCDLTNSQNVSIGCCFELAVAAKLGKHVVIAMEDGNIHDHPFVREAADIIFPSLYDAVCYINDLP